MSSNVFQTPMSENRESFGQASSSSSSAIPSTAIVTSLNAHKTYEDAQNDQDGNGEDGGARVYWYAPPSPSLQVQQAEHQRIMARAGAIQPMASQAFREELLGPLRPCKTNEIENNLRSRKIARRSARRSNTGTTSTYIGSTENSSKGKNNKEAGGIDQILNELDEHLMNSKDQLLTEVEKNGEDLFVQGETSDGSQCLSDVDAENLQQVLIEGMDRAFSQDKDNYIIASTLPLLSRNTKNWSRTASMPVRTNSQGKSDLSRSSEYSIFPLISQEGGLLRKRAFPLSPEGGVPQIGQHQRSSSIDAMDASPCKTMNRTTGSSPNKRRAAEVLNPMIPLQEHDLNIPGTKAATTSQVKVRKGHFSRSVSEGVKCMNPIEKVGMEGITSKNDSKVEEEEEHTPEAIMTSQEKKKSGFTSPEAFKANHCAGRRSPNALRQGTAPRCGLSRSAAPSSSRQQSLMNGKDSIFNVPASPSSSIPGRKYSVNAPFKQPMRRSPRKKVGQEQKSENESGSRSISRSNSNTSEIITIDDSSEDENEGKSDQNRGKGNVLPIKASPSEREVASAGPETSSVHETKEARALNQAGDISFDTSLDDAELCDALDAFEASQSMMIEERNEEQSKGKMKKPTITSNKLSQPTTVHPTSDDSFDNTIDDDVSAAILSRMDEEGW